MPNLPVPAAATGLPKFNRRSLLWGLAAASTAAAVPDAAGAVLPSESPELARLAKIAAAAASEYLAARDAKAAILKEWAPQWPTAPDEIATPGLTRREIERRLDGSGVEWTNSYGETRSRHIATAKDMHDYAAMGRDGLKRARSERGRQRERESIAYYERLAAIPEGPSPTSPATVRPGGFFVSARRFFPSHLAHARDAHAREAKVRAPTLLQLGRPPSRSSRSRHRV